MILFALVGVFFLTMAFAIIANLLVVIVLIKEAKLRNLSASWFIIAISIADLKTPLSLV